ncbi:MULTISPECIES: HPP family protein [unclassified Thioalkalivibrio]|uniref:HPP family protein n=1 Tax=unclassified Thioalkalivibrio TaxID=2621013 RepID=UPI0003734657|nr:MULTISPECIES: HPP family protein [unclassified Thioalkalivibrio]
MRTGRGLLLGDFLDTTNHKDKLIALIGAVIGLYLSLEVAASVTESGINGLILASLGATAVLLFAAPRAALSQPWNVLGGHAIAAIVGVAVRQAVDHPLVAAALAVGLTVYAMYYLRCLHPPGGATALYAVVGGASVEELGLLFILHPVLSSVAVMLMVAIVINYPFPWRRYPAALARLDEPSPAGPSGALERAGLSQADLEHAMRDLNLYLDMTEDDLARLYLLARRHHEHPDAIDPADIRPGQCYSNGAQDHAWSVRKVLARDGELITYRVISGAGVPEEGRCSVTDFVAWAHHRLDAPG